MSLFLFTIVLFVVGVGGCAPVKNGHYHLTSIHEANISRTCHWDFRPGILYLELERYVGRYDNVDGRAHMNITMGSNVINIANGVIRFEGKSCVLDTTTRLEFQLWLAFVFHEKRVTLKVLGAEHVGPFVECFTFDYVKDKDFSVTAYTSSGM